MKGMITVRDIGISFGGLVAIESVSLSVPAGSITGLIGPNGAGKTTLFSIIAGFLHADRGTVSLDGEEITGLPPHVLFHRGLMRTFQIPRLFDHMTVLENLMVVPAGQGGENLARAWFAGRSVRREDARVRARALEALDFLRLERLAGELAGNLSGGQKKLLELGRTMMSNCTTILLDEPAAGVNRTLLADLVRDIKRLNREFGKTFCVIEHDMDLVADLCDPVIVMAEGRILAEGRFAEIRADPAVREAYLGGSARFAEDC
jgi:branched-chain amino acid transport system ATP-binding protein